MSSTKKKPLTLLSPSLLSTGQQAAIDRLYSCDATMLIARMGAGKTIISLTCMAELIADDVMGSFLVFAPLKVCNSVWAQEAAKWEHTAGLNVQVCTGPEAKRLERLHDVAEHGGVAVLNFDNMAWFFQAFKKDHGFDGLLLDELSKLKGGGKGFKKMRPHLSSFSWVTGLTGTPASENFEGLFYQVYALDGGARFGGRKDLFLSTYFSSDYNGYNWTLQADGAEKITALLDDLVYTVPDYRHTLPPIHHELELIPMPEAAADLYAEFSKTLVLEILGNPVQTADSMAVLSGKLQQLASGALYIADEWGERIATAAIHDAKITACKQCVQALNGEPVIICYWYAHELERLREAFPDAIESSEAGAVEQWNAGGVPVLLLQPASAGHGIQLQDGGSRLIWFAPVWSNDLTEQTEARIWRQGQKDSVHVTTLVMEGTIDALIVDRVEGKKVFDGMFRTLLGAE